MSQESQTQFQESRAAGLHLYTGLASWLLRILVLLSEGSSISLYLLHILLCNFSIIRKNKNRSRSLLLPNNVSLKGNYLQTYVTVLSRNFHAVCMIGVLKAANIMSQNILYIWIFIFSLKNKTQVIHIICRAVGKPSLLRMTKAFRTSLKFFSRVSSWYLGVSQ